MYSCVIIVCSCLLLSCAMGPDYERPATDVSGTFRMGEASAEGAAIANLPWWELLRDPALQQLIRIALEENKDLQRAVATLDEFQARALLARSEGLPGASVSGNIPSLGRKTEFRVPGFPNPFNYFLNGTLSWELDLWGRVKRSNEAALAELLSKEEHRRAVVLQLVSGVAESYFNLLQFDAQLDIARHTLQLWAESLSIAQARLKQGLTSRLETDQFKGAHAQATARLAEVERQMRQGENQLSVLLGRRPFFIPRGRTLSDQVLPPVVPSGLPSALLQRRPDVLQAEQELVAVTARIGVVKAERFPVISLTGLLGVASPQLSQLFTNPAAFGAAGFGASAPLLNGRVLGFQEEAVEAQARQALAQYQQTTLIAFREVEDSLVGVRTARAQSDAQQLHVLAVQSGLTIVELRYNGGLVSFLEVLEARRNLFEAKLVLTSTRRLYLVSVVQLYKALGGGWSAEGGIFPGSTKG